MQQGKNKEYVWVLNTGNIFILNFMENGMKHYFSVPWLYPQSQEFE